MTGGDPGRRSLGRAAESGAAANKCQCRVLKGTGSQLVVSVCQHTLVGSVSKAFYAVAVELFEAAHCVCLS